MERPLGAASDSLADTDPNQLSEPPTQTGSWNRTSDSEKWVDRSPEAVVSAVFSSSKALQIQRRSAPDGWVTGDAVRLANFGRRTVRSCGVVLVCDPGGPTSPRTRRLNTLGDG